MMADVFLYYIVPAMVIINTVIFVFVSFDFFKANRAGKKVENFKNDCADFLDKLDVFLKEVKKCPANIIEAVSVDRRTLVQLIQPLPQLVHWDI